jgi:hypothetical protein
MGSPGATTGTSMGSGGAASDLVCVTSPSDPPFAGTDDCPAPSVAAADTLDAALAAGGISRCKVQFDPSNVATSGWPTAQLVDKHRLPDFTPLFNGPLRLPGYARNLEGRLNSAMASSSPVANTIAELSARRGHPLAHVCMDLGPFAAASGDATPLATAILKLDSDQGQPGDEPTVRAAAQAIPIDLQTRLASIVGAIDLSATAVTTALGTTSKTDRDFLAHTASLYYPGGYALTFDAAHVAKLDAVDLGAISEAAAELAQTIERADLTTLADATFAPLEVDTPIGKITIHDSSADTYLAGGPGDGTALLFDLGGDDTYEVPAGASDASHPVSVAIDVRGKDHYGYHAVPVALDTGLLPSDGAGRYQSAKPPTEDYGPITLSKTARQGAGNAGIGFLFDLGTQDDVYQSLAMSQGFGSVGVGVLYDGGGDDDYAAEAASQGASTYGIGALIDKAGKDHYASFAFSQGFGGAEGVGALFDAAGDDVYYCDPGDPTNGHALYFSPQLPGTGNSSMSQGAAQGRRPQTATDESFMAGGLGILHDAAGNDQYTASVFAQGAGYWQGIGLLLDGGTGDDIYNAYWYIQGSAAHFALAYFLDEGGNDKYDPTFDVASTSIGVGHDFSAGIHVDLGGNDTYRAPGLSLGSGNVNGIGMFINVGGDDSYIATDPTLGAGNYSSEIPYGDPRQDVATIGIFVDSGGTDTYTIGGVVRALNNTTWSYDPQPYTPPQMVTKEHGCGADAQAGSVSLP